MNCPECGENNDRVVYTDDQGKLIRRRRECRNCEERWTTHEKRIVYGAREVEG